MEPITKLLNGIRLFGRRIAKPSAIRDEQMPGRQVVQKVFRIWLDGYNAGLEIPADRLLTQISAGTISDSRGLFDGAFGGMASLYLSSRTDERGIQQMLDIYPEQSGSVGLGFGAALSHLGVDVAFSPKMVAQHAGWLCLDSYGFHEGYFHWTDTLLKTKIPAGVCAEALRPFDQGLGRALWAMGEANPKAVEKLICGFDGERLPDLWQGLGLMIGYWGCDDETDLKRFLRHAGHNRTSLQLGVALATMMRMDTNDMADHTEGACNIICQASSKEVTNMTHDSHKSASEPNSEPVTLNSDLWHLIIKHTFVRA